MWILSLSLLSSFVDFAVGFRLELCVFLKVDAALQDVLSMALVHEHPSPLLLTKAKLGRAPLTRGNTQA